jgi:hypothetical protein
MSKSPTPGLKSASPCKTGTQVSISFLCILPYCSAIMSAVYYKLYIILYLVIIKKKLTLNIIMEPWR